MSDSTRRAVLILAIVISALSIVVSAGNFALMVSMAHGQDMRGNGMMIGPVVGNYQNLAPECPSDKPIRKTVDMGIVSCTLLACLGKLVCPHSVPPTSPECFRMPASDCNTCTRGFSHICLSQDELDKAR